MWTLSHLPRPPSSTSSRLLSEAELSDVWAERAYAGRFLVDCCGRHLRVVFPGRRWGGPGPDFVGAVLAQADGQLIRGDVEVHVRASSWAAHGHVADAAYRQVVLHVVQAADGLALDWRGGHIPTVQLELDPDPGRPPPAHRRIERVPCVRQAVAVRQIVEAAGLERFRARVARFEGDLSAVAPDQALWRGAAEALGFRRNVQPFGLLAEAVPWVQAAAVVAERGPVGLAGLLLGTAGLLGAATLPEAHAWRAMQRSLGARALLRTTSWDRRQVRAAAAPEQRCRGLAELAARWVGAAATGVWGAGATGVCAAWAHDGPAAQVIDAVSRQCSQRRPDLWRLCHAPPWIGRGRAQVIAVNVLVPFAAAAGVTEAESLFTRLPGEPSNRVVRYMAGQLAGPGIRFRGACQQQGLLQLFKVTCAARVCERCPARARSRLLATSAGGPSSKGRIQTK